MPQAPIIEVERLSKTFRARKAARGIAGALRQTFSPEYTDVEAVREISFQIGEGERVSFIGPNGAGKSTTIKMLTGILYPSAGQARVAGFVPWEKREELSYHMGCVFGQRSQLWYHLSARESFELIARIYRVERALFKKRLDELHAVFKLEGLAEKRVSEMSLGERMRCELVASLIHAPGLILLDEPSIGLDVVARLALRDFIRDFSKQNGVTVLLTSHDTGDIEGVCERVLVVNRGKLAVDCSVDDLKRLYIKRKTIVVQTSSGAPEIELAGLTCSERETHQASFAVDPAILPVEQAMSIILQHCEVTDISIQDPPLDQIISHLYKEGA